MSTPVKDCPQREDTPERVRGYTPEQLAAQSQRVATREDRGLPHHPDGTGWAPCPACDGVGETYREHVDPQQQDAVDCRECGGTGRIRDGVSDPLLDMREPRPWALCLDSCCVRYTAARRRAMRPSIGLLQLAMVENAIRCDVTMRGLLTAARRAA